MAIAHPSPPIFNTSQISQYYDRISLPSVHRHTSETAHKTLLSDSSKALAFLSAVQMYQLARVPFENLALHYSPKPTIKTDALAVFDKIVTRRRGGYCMENTMLLYHVLLSLGFDVYATGGRVCQAVQPIADQEDWVGMHWNHMLLILALPDSQQYLLDVGFSNMAPVAPMLLVDNFSMRNSGLTEVRLVKTANSAHRSPQLDLWEYQIKFANDSDWIAAYCFSELRFTPGDFACMSFYTSMCEDSWFTKEVVVTVMIMDDKQERIVGDITLFRDECKKRVDGESQPIAMCSSEEQRIDIIEAHFGIRLTDEERAGIIGRVSELR